jgi:hypothetical protein
MAPAQNEVYLTVFGSVGKTSAKSVTSYPASSTRMAVERPTTPAKATDRLIRIGGSEEHVKWTVTGTDYEYRLLLHG